MRRSAACFGRTSTVAVVLGAVVALGAGCVPASPDANTYRDAASQSIGTAVSELATIEEMLRLLASDDIMRPAVVTQLRYSEDGLEKSTQWFTGLNPPTGSDGFGKRVGTLLQRGGNLLTEARIAVHRGQVDRYTRIADDLKTLGDHLDKVEGRLS